MISDTVAYTCAFCAGALLAALIYLLLRTLADLYVSYERRPKRPRQEARAQHAPEHAHDLSTPAGVSTFLRR